MGDDDDDDGDDDDGGGGGGGLNPAGVSGGQVNCAKVVDHMMMMMMISFTSF